MGETLERRLEGVESAKDFPSRIVGEAERLSFLVENILSFNRLDKATVTTHRQDVTLAELLEPGRADAEAFTDKPVKVRIESGGDVNLRVDGDLVKLLLSNLINNACKYNQRDAVDVVVAATAERDNAILRVSDNGSGIAKHEWESIFTEFVRASSSGASRGFGLGLALCRRIMTLHDGTIRVANSNETGTTFEMVFPKSSPELGTR
jgi:K+-sensing histidine kinase KdpD